MKSKIRLLNLLLILKKIKLKKNSEKYLNLKKKK